MHAGIILPELLGGTIHKTRIKSLVSLVTGVICHKKLQLSELGRNLHHNKDRSGIRIVDRFLGNTYYQENSKLIYGCLTKAIIGDNKTPNIIVDWSVIPNSKRYAKEEYQVLRASFSAEGRSITLYEEVHPQSEYNKEKTHNQFLIQLASLLPEDCKPCIITDAGFRIPWFKAVLKLGWNYVGRIRGDVHFNDSSGFQSTNRLFSKATFKPQYLGWFTLAKHNPFQTHFYIYTHNIQGRKKRNRNQTLAQNKESLTHSKGYREPWLIVSSLKLNEAPQEIIKKYKSRMGIEEAFRDTKSTRYGFSFNDNHTIKPQRYIVWLLLAAIASLVAWMVGYIAEKHKIHYQFQANTSRHKRVLSFVFLGCCIIKKKINILFEWPGLDSILQGIMK